MKIIPTILIITFGLISSNLSIAASGLSVGQVKSITWFEEHNGVLIKQDNMQDLGGCGRSDYYILNDQHPHFKEIYSLILSSHISSQPLRLHIDGCYEGISKIKHMSSTKE